MERIGIMALLKFKALTLQTNLKVELDWLKKNSLTLQSMRRRN